MVAVHEMAAVTQGRARAVARLRTSRKRQVAARRRRSGQSAPWYTYPAIEFLRQLDFSDRTVFEYGSGMSTMFWAKKAKHVVSVEDDEQWCETLRNLLPSNAELIYEPDLSKFPGIISPRE